MQELVTKYSANFPKHIPLEDATLPQQDTVLLTGSTGGLGASILARLVQSPDVARVYALNRTNDTALTERQKSVFQGRGYDPALIDSPKVVLLEADLAEPRLSLSEQVFQEVCCNN